MPDAVLRDAQVDVHVPDRWLAVLDALADACAAERADSATTDLVSRRIRHANGSRTARTMLRLLRRRGYVSTRPNSGDGSPVRWALTASGKSLRTPRRDL
jgi:hypothetical protein